MFLSGCLGTKYLKDDEYLLYKQKIEGNDQVSSSQLVEFYRQEPNKRMLFFPFSPYIYLYQWGLNNYDKDKIREEKVKVTEKFNQKIEAAQNDNKENKTERLTRRKERKLDKLDTKLEEGNLFMQWGEPLAIYDSALSRESKDQMLKYLYSKGYFHGETAFDIDTAGKKIIVKYQIKENEPYVLDSLIFATSDPNIDTLYKKNLEERLLIKEENYDEAVMAAERERIDEMLKNNGYFDFSRQYVEYNVDTTTLGDRKVMVETRILDPAKRGYHKVFTIDSVNFTTDASVTGAGNRQHESFKNVDYHFFEDRYSKKILDRRLFLYPDSVYSKEKTFETQRQLSNLDIFKFININYDTTGGQFIANIFTSPLKKYTTSNEVGITVSEQLPGPFYNFTLKNRNVFGGLEILELSGRAGIEGVASASDFDGAFKSREIGANLSVTFPQFILPISNRLRSRLGRLNPKTRFLTGYNYTDRPDYRRTNAKVSATYTWQKEEKIFYNFSLTDVNLINSSEISPTFQKRLDEFRTQGNQLYRSFEPSFVSSMIFYTIFNFGKYGMNDDSKRASFLKLFAESGGTMQNIIGTGLYENLGDSLQFFKYLKFSADWRQYFPLSNHNVFAYRINVGIAHPYGENNTLPYEKFFFAGGSNSIRAWQPRRLGPGSHTPSDTTGNYSRAEDGPINRNFEQQGELILETSFEIRRNIIGFLDGAFFIDAGNVWSLTDDPRSGAKFEVDDFWKEIAVGTGIGFRFDFNFLVLRLDVGVKVLDPAQPEGKRFVLDQIGFGKPYNENYPLVFNLGIGYPF